MSEMMHEKEFDTPQEALVHYGKKGMHWGERNDTNKAKAAIGRSKPTTKEILDARAKVGSKTRRLNTQIDKTNLATGKQQKVEAKKLSELSTDFLKDPDRVTALRLTKGEKMVNTFIAVGFPGVGTAAVAAGVGVNAARRNAISKQQAQMR